MKSLRDLQRKADARRDPDKAVADSVTEYRKQPSPRLHAEIAQAVQHLIRVHGGVNVRGVWRAPCTSTS